MKATLEFNLPDDQPEFGLATRAAEWRDLAWQIEIELRRFQDREDLDQKTVEVVRDFFYLTANDLRLDLE